MQNSNSLSSSRDSNQTETSHSTSNTTRKDFIKFSDFLLSFAFVLIVLGLFFELLIQRSYFFGFLGVSLVIIGCTFLAGFFYVKVKLIETRK